MFNKYLNSEINIEELILHQNKNNYTSEKIKLDGIVYTPKYISDFIIKSLNPNKKDIIIEPSMGHGIFIFSLLEYIEKKYKLNGNELKKYFKNNIYGIDIQNINIEEFKIISTYFFIKRNIKLIDSDFVNFVNGDTLKMFIEKNTIFDKKYDLMIGNPPYIRTKNIEENYLKFLRTNFDSCKKGNIDIYYAFMELAIKTSNKSSFITPNSWIYNKSALKLREILKENIKNIIDFKQTQIFETADTYTSIYISDNSYNNDFILYNTNIDEKYLSFNKSNMNNEGWLFYNKNKENKKIEIIKIHTPIATLSDKTYINNDLSFNNKDLIPFYKISKIKNEEDFFNSDQKIIFPYKNINNKFIIKQEQELEKETLNYLNNNKKILTNRDKGKIDKYPKWYSYGRSQGLNKYKKDSFLIIIPGMIKNDYRFFSINKNKIKNDFLFSSGFIIEVSKENVENLLKFLNSNEFKNIFQNEGKIWKGKNEEENYYSLKSSQFKKLFHEIKLNMETNEEIKNISYN